MSAMKGQYISTTYTAPNEQDIRTVRIDSAGRLMVVTTGGTGAAPVLMADNTVTPTAQQVGAFMTGYDGSTWDFVRTGATAAATPTGYLDVISGGVYNTSAPSPSNGQWVPLQLDSAGRLIVSIDLLKQPTKAVSVTVSDATDTTATATKGLWVGTGGDVAVKMVDDGSGGTAVTLKNVPSGTYVPGALVRIMSTNTTASNIVSFYGP